MSKGLKAKYHITKADGSSCEGRCFVLKLDSKDPVHARASQKAALTYAAAVIDFKHLEQLGMDLYGAVMAFLSSGRWDGWDERLADAKDGSR